ncbi:GNAT family N-acetyltransferase [Legionella sp.]|uniref:GNAT family N-acetyltransferase n=1 Tax=Legionella sp. TaxID=459 RepID=UPI000CC1989F|nr:GNAT family N-acetyltransferase [Legionella sp.]PJE15814.1 MAG: GNAT family N-acetyltransferase [Legionella sp.]
MEIISTDRIRLRTWQSSDQIPFAQMNADPQVMEHFPGILTENETEALILRINEHIRCHQFGLWAAELKETKEFIGFIGLSIPSFSTHFTPCVEIGWRLARQYWGKGLATEGAKAVLDYGFTQINLDEIVSFTATNNYRSRRVMEKIGLIRQEKDDFDNPKLALDHPLSKHVLYRLSQMQWRARLKKSP